jgi:hypothetical protein
MKPFSPSLSAFLLLYAFAGIGVVTMAQQTTITLIPCASRSQFSATDDDTCNCLEVSNRSNNDNNNNINTLLVNVDFGPDGLFDPLMNALTWGNHNDFETPIMLRNLQWTMVANWNVAAAHHPIALDAFGRQPYRRCSASTSADVGDDVDGVGDGDMDDVSLQVHNNAAMAYAIYFSAKTFFPNAYDYIGGRLRDFGLNPAICDGDGDGDGASSCEDEDAISTPWGLAYAITQETRQLAHMDGWNADGSYNRQYNRIPFQDWRSRQYQYQPDYDAQHSWKPLLETNGIGYLTRQEHVTPHIGQTAKSFYLTDEEICDLQAPPPDYDYMQELQLALARTAQLDNLKKAQVELFDNKVTLFGPLVSQYFRLAGYDLEDFEHIQAFSMVVSVLYESTVVVWKEKVRHDLIRPTTLVHDVMGGAPVMAYAEGLVVQDLPADNWEPFVRTMPHSEYPSGSACLCTAAATALKELLGDDLFSDTIGSPLVMRKIEGSVVESPVTMAYNSWDEIRTICGESRLWGGMHFSASVPQGNELCEPIGVKIHQSIVKELSQGVVPEFVMYVAEEDVGRPEEVRCPKDYKDDDGTKNDNDKETTNNGESLLGDEDESVTSRQFYDGSLLVVVAAMSLVAYMSL